ncbi:MAG: alpha/beta fold hydrolase [Pseudomonadota bacterium]
MRLPAALFLLGCVLCAAPAPAGTLKEWRESERAAAGLVSGRRTVDDVDLAYSIGGPPDGALVVLLHGYTASRDHWNRVAALLTPKYRVVIPDLPGHGDTRVPAGYRYTPGENVDTVRHFIDTLDVTGYHLVGHSMGGGLAMPLASFDRNKVLSLTLMSAAGVYENNDAPLARRIAAGENPLLVRSRGQLAPLMQELMVRPPVLAPDLLRQLEGERIRRAGEYEKTMEQMRLMGTYFTPEAYRSNLRFLRAPVQLLWGEGDRLVSVAVVEEMRPHFRQPPVVTLLKEVGHVPALEAPEQTAAALDAFFAQHPVLSPQQPVPASN